jgi:hypothetical protein
MHIWRDKRPDAARLEAGAGQTARRLAILLARCASLALAAGLAGCASPGPPLPPSLKLPAVVAAGELTATRVGDTVALHWTTPDRTTDKLLIAGPITAVICRNPPPATPPAATLARRAKAAAPPCAQAVRLAVTPGPSDAIDTLPAPLIVGPPRLLAYRVELLNARGRSAGPSPAVFALAGDAEPPVADFRGHIAKAGVVLEWAPDLANLSDRKALPAAVELTRTAVQASAPAGEPSATLRKAPAGLPVTQKEPTVTRFDAGKIDAGGAIDRTAQLGRSYSYTAQRVRTVHVGAQTLELRSAPSAAVALALRDIFPPEVPAGLVAVPGFFHPSDRGSPGTPGLAGESDVQHPAIDLSWEPDVEPRVAGYRVYRREGDSGAWQRLGAALLPVAAYRDASVTSGHTYTYRVTAVSDAGYESAPSAEVAETAPAP